MRFYARSGRRGSTTDDGDDSGSDLLRPMSRFAAAPATLCQVRATCHVRFPQGPPLTKRECGDQKKEGWGGEGGKVAHDSRCAAIVSTVYDEHTICVSPERGGIRGNVGSEIGGEHRV